MPVWGRVVRHMEAIAYAIAPPRVAQKGYSSVTSLELEVGMVAAPIQWVEHAAAFRTRAFLE